MSSRQFVRALRRGLLNFHRSRGKFSGVAALGGVVLLVQVFLLLGLGVRGVRDTLAARNDFRIPLLAGATDRDVQEFFAAARQLPSVSSVEYITREKAMELERAAHPGVVSLLESDGMNPFRDTLIVTLAQISAYDDFAAFVHHPSWKNTVDPTAFASIAAQNESWQSAFGQARTGSSAAFLLLGIAVLALLLTVLEVTRRAALGRHDDLFVERLAGADEASITLPFAVEVTALLSIALLLSLPCVLMAMYVVPLSFPLITDATAMIIPNAPILIIIECAALLFVGYIGAMFGLKIPRYARLPFVYAQGRLASYSG